MFPNRAGSEIKGTSSLTAEYATVRHGSKQINEKRITETEARESDTEQFEHSDGAESLYAQVKPRKGESVKNSIK